VLCAGLERANEVDCPYVPVLERPGYGCKSTSEEAAPPTEPLSGPLPGPLPMSPPR